MQVHADGTEEAIGAGHQSPPRGMSLAAAVRSGSAGLPAEPTMPPKRLGLGAARHFSSFGNLPQLNQASRRFALAAVQGWGMAVGAC